MIDTLQLRDNAKSELAQIRDIESGVNYLNKVSAIETWAKAEKKDAELQNLIAEQKLRTQRILGQLLKEAEKNEGGRPSKTPTPKEGVLSDLGISHKQSSTFQQIASIPTKAFDEFIKEKKEAVNDAVAELTTAGAVRLAKSFKQKKEGIDTSTEINSRLDIERELRALAHDLCKKYNKKEIELLVKFLTK